MRGGRRTTAGLATVALVVVCALVAIWFQTTNAGSSGKPASDPVDDSPEAPDRLRVTTVLPTPGGQPVTSVLPCAAHWHEHASLFAKVSGYLKTQEVDIGSRVKPGQVVTVVDMPELERDVALMRASHRQALAEVEQTRARIKSAEAGLRAAQAGVAKAEADVERWVAETQYREKEFERIRDLSRSGSIQGAVSDEKRYQLDAARAGHSAAESAIGTAREQALAAAAEVELARADLAVAEAKAEVAAAHVSKAQLMASYAQIVSPLDGIVTSRSFHPGDFVLAADRGGNRPLLQVARTDLIRVVVQIPDREVPLTNPGDPVSIGFDALPGRRFTGEVARVAHSEDPQTRTMRAEVDLPNPDGLIVDQMYGRMEIEFEPAAEGLRVPSACLVGDAREGSGQVFVVRDGVARLQRVQIGADNGTEVEIKDGLAAADDVVLRPPAGLSDGTPVAVWPQQSPSSHR